MLEAIKTLGSMVGLVTGLFYFYVNEIGIARTYGGYRNPAS